MSKNAAKTRAKGAIETKKSLANAYTICYYISVSNSGRQYEWVFSHSFC